MQIIENLNTHTFMIKAEEGYLLKNLENSLIYPSVVTTNIEKIKKSHIEIKKEEPENDSI